MPWCPKSGQRGVRRQQERDQSPDSRAGHRPRSAGPRQRHCAGHGDCRIVDVPARPRHRRAQEIQPRVQRIASRPTICATSWPSSTRGARSPAGRSCRSTTRTRSAGWPATRAPRRPATSSRSTAGCRRRFCDKRYVLRAPLDVGAGRRLREPIVGIDVIDCLRRDELVFDEHGGRHRPAMEDVEGDGDDFGAVTFRGIRRPSRSSASRVRAVRRALPARRSGP